MNRVAYALYRFLGEEMEPIEDPASSGIKAEDEAMNMN